MFTFILNIRAWLNYTRICNLTKLVCNRHENLSGVCLWYILYLHILIYIYIYNLDRKRRVTAVYRG